MRGRIEAVLNYAKIDGAREGENPAHWKGNLACALAAKGNVASRRVPAKFNRLLTFPTGPHHPRALFDNYGQGDAARLIQVIFLR